MIAAVLDIFLSMWASRQVWSSWKLPRESKIWEFGTLLFSHSHSSANLTGAVTRRTQAELITPFEKSDAPAECAAAAGMERRREAAFRFSVGVPVSHKTPCHPSPQKQIGTPAQLTEPTRTPLLYSRPETRSPRKTPEGAKREEGGENAVVFLWGSRATGVSLSP